jgi:hypothetical protein
VTARQEYARGAVADSDVSDVGCNLFVGRLTQNSVENIPGGVA